MSFVEFHDVKKIYHMGEVEIPALQGVNFEIEKGEFCVIVGASGAGKTTILNILGGMDTLTEGKVLLDGKENVFLIPYRTVSGSGEMLRGIVFDRMIVSKGRKTEIYEHPVIALTGERVSSDGSYQMILHPDNRKNQEEKDYV